MARLPRLALDGHSHLLLQRGHSGRTVFSDDIDRSNYLDALREAAAAQGLLIQGWALLPNEGRLLLLPAQASTLGRAMQALGRRFVAAHHRRHGGSGTLWDGRFRCAVVEPGAPRLDAMRWLEGPPDSSPVPIASLCPAAADAAAQAAAAGAPVSSADRSSSAGQRLGRWREPWLDDPPEYWALGNTPFDREAAYARLLAKGLEASKATALQQAAAGGWAIGSDGFKAATAARLARPVAPRLRGRPRRGDPDLS
jgi:putative transposase